MSNIVILGDGRFALELVQLSEYVTPYNYPYWLVLPERERPGVKRHLFVAWLFEEVERYQREIA